jgi:glycosidase
MKEKIIIYQLLPRLYGNRNTTCKEGGSIEENGCGKLNDITPTALKNLSDLGVSHVWYTGVLRHATQTDYSRFGIPRQHPAVVKGRAGSPYAITDYYDIDPDLAVDVNKRMEEFEKLVERTHKAGMKVIIDFVPNHVARQYKSICNPLNITDLGAEDDDAQGFSPQNNFYYCPGQRFSPYFDLYHGETEPYLEEPAKATGNDCFHNAPGMNDWYETVKLNYGVDYYAGRIGHFNPVPSTWRKMLDILFFWASKGVDAFRCDMAEMVPVAFWAWATKQVKKQYKGIKFIGEVYNPEEYRKYIASGFDYLYDKVGMYDTLREVIRGYRSTHDISHAWQQNDDIRQHMLYFLENHDEQRIASQFFAADGMKALPGLVTMALLEQNPIMIYAGQEYGERGMDKEGFSGNDGRTTIFDYWSVDTLVRAAHRKLKANEKLLFDYYKLVLYIASHSEAVNSGQMFDLMYANLHLQKQYAFLRKKGREKLLIVANFDAVPVDVDVTIPAHAFDYMKLKEGNAKAQDLITGEETVLGFKADAPVHVHVAAYSAVVLDF